MRASRRRASRRRSKRVTLRMEKVSCTLPWVQVYENETTGQRVELHSDSRFERLFEGEAVIGAAEPLAA